MTGTANFKSDTCELFNWMAPEKTCCVKHDLYTEGKIEILPGEKKKKTDTKGKQMLSQTPKHHKGMCTQRSCSGTGQPKHDMAAHFKHIIYKLTEI